MGETFGVVDVVGVVLSIRAKEDIISVWNRDNTDQNTVRFAIGEKLRHILTLDDNATIEYKDHSSSIRDRSTFRNARPYIFAATQRAGVDSTA